MVYMYPIKQVSVSKKCCFGLYHQNIYTCQYLTYIHCFMEYSSFLLFLGNTGATQAHVRELSFGEVMRWSLLPSTTELRQMYERQRVVFGECSENDCF